MVAAAHKALDERGYGMSSVRFICGTQDMHRELEQKLTEFLGTEDTILFPTCLDANAGVFEAILGPEDVMISDRLVHASIVDGIRLCKAMHDTYKHSDMAHLEEKLQEHQDKRIRADHHRRRLLAWTATSRRWTRSSRWPRSTTRWCSSTTATPRASSARPAAASHEHCGVMGKIDIITTTLGKALGGATGGCVSGRKEIVELCRQKARPYLFSNAVPPPIARGGHQGARDPEHDHRAARQAGGEREVLAQGPDRRRVRHQGGREPDRAGDALQRQARAGRRPRPLRRRHLRGRASSSRWCPQGQARIRTQLSADHDIPMLERALEAFKKVGAKHGILGLDKKGIIEKYGQ